MRALKQMISPYIAISISTGHWTTAWMRYLNKIDILIARGDKMIDLSTNTIQNLFFQQIRNLTLNTENLTQGFTQVI